MTAYAKGRTFEYRVKHHFEVEGYQVFRMAGSHSPADLLAVKEGQVTVIQCQLRRYFPPAKVEQLKELARANGWQGVLCWNERGKLCFREPTDQGGVNIQRTQTAKPQLKPTLKT